MSESNKSSEKIKYSSGAKWEDIVGYSRAIKIGDRILVSGTTAIADGNLIGEGDPYLQTKTIIENIEKVLIKAGSDLNDIVRLRTYVTDITKWEEVGRALGESFKDIRPAQTLVEINALVDPKMMVEIEAEAVINY
ncbi:MAG TPA: RidA family protein [Ignavibacteria bacterium]|nr:RidA family protein [Ignavibacteria bacterium]HMR41648.1 RidA family protein [Ignavibacteria bacterium]